MTHGGWSIFLLIKKYYNRLCWRLDYPNSVIQEDKEPIIKRSELIKRSIEKAEKEK
jgi:hypothetical protein